MCKSMNGSMQLTLDDHNCRIVLQSQDLARLNRDLSHVIIIDDNPDNYSMQPENAIPISRWEGDRSDTVLRDLTPFLERARIPLLFKLLYSVVLSFFFFENLFFVGLTSNNTNAQISPQATQRTWEMSCLLTKDKIFQPCSDKRPRIVSRNRKL